MDTRIKERTIKWKQTIIFSMFVLLAAQINFDIFTTYFRVSLGIIMIPILIFLFQRIPLLPVTVLSGVGVWLSRALFSGVQNGFAGQELWNYFPELVFYMVYGFLVWFYFRKKDYKIQGWKSYCFLLLADYCANFFELFLRLQGDALTMKLQSKILLIALIRTVLLWVILTGLGSYKLELLTQEHASRYQRLLLLISKLNGEVIWMKKNTELIEKTMELSYKLFSEMQKQNVDRELSQTALAVAKDIHEIKKEYMLILRGISEAMDLNLQDGSMSLSDILTVMETTLQQAAAEQGKKLTFAKEYKTNIMTDKHYFLLSIFRNLFTNALEANETGEVTLRFTQWEEGQEDCFSICDDGPGIPKENIPNIFTPGFSTKINFSTGEINRGLGLNLVKDMIENQFHGKITVESVPGQTTFLIRIPKIQLEVD